MRSKLSESPAPSATGDRVIVRLNARVQPLDRGDMFEAPLNDALHATGMGEVVAGRAKLGEAGEIAFCELEIVLREASDGVLGALRGALEDLGAPKGSRLIWNGGADDLEFGALEGLAVYLNGTDLPASAYADSDVNFVCEELDRLLGSEGRVVSHWDGARETALYLYGRSAETMLARIRPFLDSYPLCDKARIVTIA